MHKKKNMQNNLAKNNNDPLGLAVSPVKEFKEKTKPEIMKTIDRSMNVGFEKYVKDLPIEMTGLLVRPIIEASAEASKLVGITLKKTGFEKMGNFILTDVQIAQNINKKLKTVYTDPYSDLAFSLILGAVGGGASAFMQAKKITDATKAAMAIGGITAMSGDFAINRTMEKIVPVIEKSKLSPTAKTGVRLSLDLILGFGSGLTFERHLQKILTSPRHINQINKIARNNGTPKDIMNYFRKAVKRDEINKGILETSKSLSVS